jgi:centriolar protein POC1
MKLWDLQRGNDRSASCLTTFYDYGAQVNDVQFHPSGTCLVSGSADHKIRLYDIRSDKLIQLFSTTSCTQSNATTSHDDAGGVSSLSFHPNGNYLLSSSSTGSSSYSDTSTSENNIHMWDLREGRLLHSMPGTHTTPNNKCDHRQRFSSSTTTSGCAAFSFDGTRFATGGVDNRILVWNSTQLCKQIFATEQSNVNVAPSRPCDARNVAPSSHAVRQPFVNINSNNRPASAPITKTQSKWATATTSTEFIGSDDNYCKGSPSISSFEENLIKVGRAPLNLLSTVHFQADPNETLAKATERIAMQLDLITKTLSLLDTRLAAQESNVEQIMASLNLSRNDEPTYRST